MQKCACLRREAPPKLRFLVPLEKLLRRDTTQQYISRMKKERILRPKICNIIFSTTSRRVWSGFGATAKLCVLAFYCCAPQQCTVCPAKTHILRIVVVHSGTKIAQVARRRSVKTHMLAVAPKVVAYAINNTQMQFRLASHTHCCGA